MLRPQLQSSASALGRPPVQLPAGLVVVCAAEPVLGVLLWTGQRHAWQLSLVLLPAELFYSIGFALPFGSLLGLVRTGLVLTAHARPKVARP